MAKELTKDERIIVRGYKEGLKNIRKDINLLYEKHAKDGKLSMADLSKYNRLTNLEKNIADNLKTAYDVQVKTTKKAVKGAFESSFYYSTFELEQEAKIPLMFGLLKKEAVNAVVEGPNRWPQIAKGHTKLTNAKIRDQIMQGVVRGKDAGQVTKAIAKEMNIAASKACRIVRTETHRAQNQGSLDSYTEAYKKGVLIQKVWVATLDDRTRDSHRVMDGQVVEVYEDFIMPGDIKASAPGLSGSASGDINCRCTIRAEVVGFTPQARRARGDGIIPQQTYQQWAKSKGIPFDKNMADEVKKLLEARGQTSYEDKLKGMLIKIEPTGFISPDKIEPVNPVTDVEKFKAIAYQLKTKGWEGRPILTVDVGGGRYQALTGSHRIYAAIDADVQVPVVEISSLRKLSKVEQELLDSLPTLQDDEQRYAALKQLRDKKIVSKDVFNLIDREMDAYQEKGYASLASKYDVLVEKEKNKAKKLLAEAERKQAEKLAKQLASPAKQELDNYLNMLKTKYKNMWAEATDKELEKLESLEKAVYKK